MKYPKWKYHHSAPPQIVQDYEEEAALSEDWVDSPGQVRYPAAEELGDEADDDQLLEPGSPKPKRKRK